MPIETIAMKRDRHPVEEESRVTEYWMPKSLIRRRKWPSAGATYGRTSRVGRRSIDGLTSAPFALDFAFRPHARTVVERDGRIEARSIIALTGGAVGAEPVKFLETDGSSEFVEVRPAPWLRAEIVEDLRAAEFAEHERIWNRPDPALFVLAVRVRADMLGGPRLDALELEQLVRNALARCLEAVGASPRPKTQRGLDLRRLDRVIEFVDAHLDQDLRLVTLADVAATSRHHFARMFRLSTGQSPHAFVAARRVERAAEAIRAGQSIAQAAAIAGYGPGHSFRTAFEAQFARAPSRYAQMVQGSMDGQAPETTGDPSDFPIEIDGRRSPAT